MGIFWWKKKLNQLNIIALDIEKSISCFYSFQACKYYT